MLKEALLSKNHMYIVGVSGGCDSMALLDLMVSKGYKVIVAHVNYHLREDTAEDYQVVHDYCLAHHIPFFYKEYQPSDYSRGNFQAVARELRYDFFSHLYRHYRAHGVVLGHHLDDHIETIYMYLERGTRTRYLGIEEKTTVQRMTIIRPLLEVPKAALRAYCEDNGVPFHDDYTNFETHYTRDRIRNTILNTYTEKEKQALLDHARAYNERYCHQESELAPYLKQYHEQGYSDYQTIPENLMRAFLYEIIEEATHNHAIGDALIREIKHQIYSSKPNIIAHLPANKMFIKEYDHIYIANKTHEQAYAYTFEHYEHFTCAFFSLAREGHINYGVPLTADDYPITIRSFHEGDRIVTQGGTKKLSRLFINAKVPRSQRKVWPILVNRRGEIILVPGIAKNIAYLAINPNCFVLK